MVVRGGSFWRGMERPGHPELERYDRWLGIHRTYQDRLRERYIVSWKCLFQHLRTYRGTKILSTQ